MDILSDLSGITRKGAVNFPGVSSFSKRKASEFLAKDATLCHCFFVADGRHNHLSHHILAAYDFGAPPSLLQKIYEDEMKIQRPIMLSSSDEHIAITEENWLRYIGDQNAYYGYSVFFANKLQEIGFHALLDQYLFSENANRNGANMLPRMVAMGIHAFIHMGYGIEFGNYAMVITGLAQTAVQGSPPEEIFNLSFDKTTYLANGYNIPGKQSGRQPSRGLSLFEVLQQLSESDILTPPPYDIEASYSRRGNEAFAGNRAEEIFRICSQYYTHDLNETEIEQKSEELIWVATLLLFATGRRGREPRLDFCFMHVVTSSIFIKPFLYELKDDKHRNLLLRTYLCHLIYYWFMSGRPKIQPDLLMSYTDTPRPPLLPTHYRLDNSAIGTPMVDEDYSPWPTMTDAVLFAPDAHTVKVLRTLFYATQRFGDTPPGGAIGSWKRGSPKEETIPGSSRMDGSIFVRAAGVLMDYMGWVTYGQTAREDWDRSGLGWDEAWDEVQDTSRNHLS